MRSYVTPSDTGSLLKTWAHPKSMGSSSMIKEILILFSVLCAKCPKVSRVPKSQQTTITSHFGSRTFSLPSFQGLLVTILRLLGSQNTGPSRRGAKEIQNLRLLAPYKNYPSGLGSYKMKFGGSPLPSTSHPARHRNPSTSFNKKNERVSILVQFPYISPSFC